MTHLPRLKPEPIPALHPVPEVLADGRLNEIYEETKAAFGVPWMGVVAMAFAHYPSFYGELWAHLGPVAKSEAFADACRQLRCRAEAAVRALDPADITPELQDAGYHDPDLRAIDQVVEVFSEGNMPYLLMATIARAGLEGAFIAAPGEITPADAPPTSPIWPAGQPLTLIEEHHQTAEGKALYGRIRSTLGLPFVNTDYRALARWPGYFDLAWTRLEPKVPDQRYADIVRSVHDHAMALIGSLPGLGGLNTDRLRTAAARDASTDEVLQVVRLFQWLLPGLVTNVAFFRAELGQ